MADRDDDTGSRRGFASMDRETRERIARKGGEASHRNDSGRSSEGGSRSESGSERGGSSGGRESGGREGEGQGIRYDEEAGQCRDGSGRFVECPPGMEGRGTRYDPNKERVSSKGGEARGGGSSGGSRGGSSGGRSGRD